MAQPLAALQLGQQFLVLDIGLQGGRIVVGETGRARKTQRAFAAQQPVRRSGHAGGHLHRMAHAAHAGYGAQLAQAVHHGRIHFDGHAVHAQHGTGAGIEARIVFQHRDGLHGRLQRGLQAVAGVQQAMQACLRCRDAAVAVLRACADAAMRQHEGSTVGGAVGHDQFQ